MLKSKIDIKQIFNFAVIVILAGIITSCASTRANMTPVASKTVFEQKIVSQKLFKLKSWTAKGVLGIIYDNQAESANYIYSQDGDSFSIKLYGPLGVGSVEITGDSNEVSLKNSKGQKVKAKDAKSLMLQQLGWYVPVEGLKYWIKAIAIPNIEKKEQLGQNNLIEKLSQKGWDISYKKFEFVDSKYPLPTKIRMSRDNLILKIVIKSWQV